jgi:putative glycosyltransferase (TIGR04372 family)
VIAQSFAMQQSLGLKCINYIREEGFFRFILALAIAVIRRVWKGLEVIALSPVVVLVVLLRPFVLIRFGIIDASRIGHFCNTEGNLCRRDIEYGDRRVLDFIACSKLVCNQQLKLMFSRSIRIYSFTGLIRALLKVCTLLTRSDIHKFSVTGSPANYRLLEYRDPHIQFTEDELLRGKDMLRELGVPTGAKWVCLHNRDTAYLDRTQKEMDWTYHNFRDFDIESMADCAQELAGRGYYVLRMGAEVEHQMASNNPKVIDYANHPARSEFADIYLLGNCHFYLGSDSGIFSVASLFKAPFSFVNFPAVEALYEHYYWNPTPFIFKRAWHRDKGRFLSIREVFELGIANASLTHLYEDQGVDLINNSPDEIRELAIEIDEQLKGEWQSSPEDDKLHQRFWDIVRDYAPSREQREVKARVGTAFLRAHADLLN